MSGDWMPMTLALVAQFRQPPADSEPGNAHRDDEPGGLSGRVLPLEYGDHSSDCAEPSEDEQHDSTDGPKRDLHVASRV